MNFPVRDDGMVGIVPGAPRLLESKLSFKSWFGTDPLQVLGVLHLAVLFSAIPPLHPHVDIGTASFAVDDSKNLNRLFAEGDNLGCRLDQDPVVVFEVAIQLDPTANFRAVNLPEIVAVTPSPRVPNRFCISKNPFRVAGLHRFVHHVSPIAARGFWAPLCQISLLLFRAEKIFGHCQVTTTGIWCLEMTKEEQEGGAPRRPATEQEIESAIRAMSQTDFCRVRGFADSRVRILRKLALGDAGLDFLQQAICLTLEGIRRWYPAEKEWAGHLMDTIGSLTSHRFSSVETKHEPVAVSEFVSPSEEDGGMDRWPDTVPADCPTPEEQLLIRERIRAEHQAIETLYQVLADVPSGPEVLLCKMEGMTGLEIQQQLGIDTKRYGAVDKRIRREIAKMAERGIDDDQ